MLGDVANGARHASWQTFTERVQNIYESTPEAQVKTLSIVGYEAESQLGVILNYLLLRTN
jgi:hypothetical protein